MNPVTIIWRFNLSQGVDRHAFFEWLRENVWASTAAYGCSTRGYRCDTDGHDFATIATWPDESARAAWEEAELAKLPRYPGVDGAWGAQTDLEMIRLTEWP